MNSCTSNSTHLLSTVFRESHETTIRCNRLVKPLSIPASSLLFLLFSFICAVLLASCNESSAPEERPESLEVNSVSFRGGAEFSCIALDWQDPNRVYAGTVQSGIFLSVDGGQEWQARNDGLDNLHIAAIMVDPHSSAKLWASTLHGLYTSEDYGEHWYANNAFFSAYAGVTTQPLAVSADGTQMMAVHHNDALNEFLILGSDSTLSGELYRSIDGGKTWEQVDSLPNFRSGTRFPIVLSTSRTGEVLLFVSEYGVYHSSDWGITWTDYSQGLESTATLLWQHAILVDDVLYATGYVEDAASHPNRLFRRQSEGEWETLGGTLPETAEGIRGMNPISVSTDELGTLYWSYPEPETILYYSLDHGEQWYGISRVFQESWIPDAEIVYPSPHLGMEGFIDIRTVPAQQNRLYAGTSDGLWVSDDTAFTWTESLTGIHAGDIVDIVTMKRSADITDLVVSADQFLTLVRHGDTEVWETLTPPTESTLIRAQQMIQGENGFWVSYVSTDSLVLYNYNPSQEFQWTDITYDLPQPENPSLLKKTRLMFREISPSQAPVELYLVINLNYLLAEEYAIGGVYRLSDEDPQHWIYLDSQPGMDQVTQGEELIYYFTTDPYDSLLLFAALRDQGLWFSSDKGQTWKRSEFSGVASDESPTLTGSMAFSSAEKIYAGFSTGVFVSTDKGRHFNPIYHASEDQGLKENEIVSAVALDEAEEGALWAAISTRPTPGAVTLRLIRSMDGGNTWQEYGLSQPLAAIGSLRFEPEYLIAATAGSGLVRISRQPAEQQP